DVDPGVEGARQERFARLVARDAHVHLQLADAGERRIDLDFDLRFYAPERLDAGNTDRAAVPERHAWRRRRHRNRRIAHLDGTSVHHRDHDGPAFTRVDEAVLIARLVFVEPHFSDADSRLQLEALDDAGEVDRVAGRRDGARTGAAAREGRRKRQHVAGARGLGMFAAMAVTVIVVAIARGRRCEYGVSLFGI